MTYMQIASALTYVDDECLCLVEQMRKPRRKWRGALKKVAVVILALLVGASVWLTVDEGARAAFQRWWREMNEHSVIYHFFGGSTDALPQYELNWVPEGFVLVSDINHDYYNGSKARIMLYENPETGDGFIFGYDLIFEDKLLVIGGYVDEDAPLSEHCTVNGLDGEYYPPTDLGSTDNLIWVDEKNGVVLHINSNIDKDTVLHIAECISLCETGT